jgi:hypothetical protein
VNPRPDYVSVIDPISPAIERTRTVLFRPFDLGKWFVIGFSAWLAQLGARGGGTGGGGGRGSGHGGSLRPGAILAEIREGLMQAKDYVTANLHWIAPVAILLLIVGIAVALLVVWLSSRGRFTFLYCVAQNRSEFWNPWQRYRCHGNSLFAFRVVLGIIGVLTAGAFLVLGVGLAVASYETLGFTPLTIMGIVTSVLLAMSTGIVFGVIGMFTTDFVAPIMYQHTLRCTQAWRVFLDVLSENQARFILYVLFQIVIWMVMGVLVLAAGCATCCIACCLFAIPYMGVVAFLPLSVFRRSYSLYYLAQYGPEFYVFSPEGGESPTTEPTA